MIKTPSSTKTILGSVSPTPLGEVWAAVNQKGLWALEYQVSKAEFIQVCRQRGLVEIEEDEGRSFPILKEVREYLEGSRREFTTPIDWTGMTEFQVKVRRAVMGIPYGETATYGEIAVQIGKPGTARAVGRANATNPIPFVIPCHRLVGADGSLRGYGGAGGIETKRWLLEVEKSRKSY